MEGCRDFYADSYNGKTVFTCAAHQLVKFKYYPRGAYWKAVRKALTSRRKRDLETTYGWKPEFNINMLAWDVLYDTYLDTYYVV